jgi:hypothetical protein
MNGRLLDEMLEPYERRAAVLAEHEIAERRAGMTLGWELNRLQGAERDEANDRLADLFASGRITTQDYVELVTALAEAEQTATALV